MTPKEKAQELIGDFRMFAFYNPNNHPANRESERGDNAKQCAYLMVNKILKHPIYTGVFAEDELKYLKFWEDVKSELDKL